MRFINHPLRQQLNDEAHARPFDQLQTPARLSHLVFLHEDEDWAIEHALVAELCEALGCQPPKTGSNHFVADLGVFRFKWARHSEFTSYTITVPGEFAEPFSEPAITRLPAQWLARLPGRLLVGAHAAVQYADKLPSNVEKIASRWFSGNALIGAAIGDGIASAYTDFRIHGDGFSRFLISDGGMGPRQAGRMAQRLFEIDTYRMMALLAFPVAKQLFPQLSESDRELAVITLKMDHAKEEDEPELLSSLTRLAGKIENSVAVSSYRFSAARAYYILVERRVGFLRESRIPGMQPFREFMERRLAPAMDTCKSVERHQESLAERVGRAADLLRTRVDVSREIQNQQLLESMDKRAHLQLRLQETVEGLSVAAITYYTVGLVGYGAKGLKAFGLHVEPDMAIGVAIPLVALGVALGIRQIRRSVTKEMHQG